MSLCTWLYAFIYPLDYRSEITQMIKYLSTEKVLQPVPDFNNYLLCCFILVSLQLQNSELNFRHRITIKFILIKNIITFRAYIMWGKHYNHEKSRLWHIYTFWSLKNEYTLFFSYECMRVFMWVNTIMLKRCIQLNSNF